MRKSLREQLKTTSKSLTQRNSDYAQEIAALTRESEDAPAQRLKAHADKLKQIEDGLESA